MADKENLIFRFFEKWKTRSLNKLGKDMLKNNPSLEKNLKAMDASFGKFEKELQKRKDSLSPEQKRLLKKRHG
jgi:hypothetical protein